MGLVFNAYSLVLLFAGIVSLFVSVVIFQRTGKTVRWFAYMMLVLSIWALGYGIELACTTLEQMLLCINVEYIGVALLPVCWIMFIIRFTGNEKWLKPVTLFLLFAIPLITLFLVFTKEYNHLHYRAYSLDTSGPFPLLSITPGIWYRIHTFYFYTMLVWGIVLLIYRFRKADPVFKRQTYVIIIGALIPWLTNCIYLVGFRPFRHIDLTPYSFIAASLIIAFGLLRLGLFDLVPVARGKIIEAMQDGIAVLDPNNRIIDFNPAFKKIFHTYEAQFIGSNIQDVLPRSVDLTSMLENSSGYESMDIQLSRNNVELEYAVSSTKLFEHKTVFSGTIVIFRDVSESRKAEHKLEEQAEELYSLNQLKDKLFSIIAHDLRSPMVSLIQTLNLIGSDIITEKEFSEMLPILLKNTQHASGLLENLLFWSKSQLRGETISPEKIDVKDLTETEIQLTEKRAADKGVQIFNQIDADTFAFADKNMISLVIRNLLSNAVKFCRKGDSITITAGLQGKHLCVGVKDTGIGISPENLDKLFGMQLFTSRGINNEEGTGLGLLLCKDFVEKNGGRIWAESEESRGSTFYFTMPRG
ncbi:MAG: PAS domain-containing protein [Filimonas sp.]|nr:PAS domain-containing protein [Filimonas sp.]